MSIAVIRIRGRVGVRRQIKDTMMMLRLNKKHNCIILPDNNKIYMGMLSLIKDYVTYGKINDETLKELLSKRLKRKDKKSISADVVEKTVKTLKAGKLLKDIPEIVPVLTLNPPKKGFEDLGIKRTFKQGGSLGLRDDINELIKRMI